MLKRIWDFLFHSHKWSVIDTRNIEKWDGWNYRKVGMKYYLQCTKCGNVISKKL